MPFSRKRFSRRPKKSFTRRPRYGRRRKNSKYSRRRQPTGIPPKKYIKVRKDIMYYVPTSSTSWNSLIVGGAQVTGPSTFSYFRGASVSAVDTAVDTTAVTGVAQWLSFYNRYYVSASKVKVSLMGVGNAYGLIATLVPTMWNTLAATEAGVAFDSQNIDPGELPYSRRAVLGGNLDAGGAPKTISNYISIKRMLGVKDLSDVASDPANTGVTTAQAPFVPNLTDATSTGITIQPNTGSQQAGIYWNLVVQNISQNQTTIPGTPVEPEFSIRMQVTSYICLHDRKTLLNN